MKTKNETREGIERVWKYKGKKRLGREDKLEGRKVREGEETGKILRRKNKRKM